MVGGGLAGWGVDSRLHRSVPSASAGGSADCGLRNAECGFELYVTARSAFSDPHFATGMTRSLTQTVLTRVVLPTPLVTQSHPN